MKHEYPDWNYSRFLHDRSWISPWTKSISNELDITIHVIASQLSGYCDTGMILKDRRFIVIYGFVMSSKKWNNICTYVTNRFGAHSSVLWYVFPSLLRNSEIKHQNSPLHILYLVFNVAR